jgi:hypothetical protein
MSSTAVMLCTHFISLFTLCKMLMNKAHYKKEHADTSSGAYMQANGIRPIKYTFNRRKRKCVSLNSTPPCAVLDKGSDLLSAPKEGGPYPNAEPQVNLIDSTQGDKTIS